MSDGTCECPLAPGEFRERRSRQAKAQYISAQLSTYLRMVGHSSPSHPPLSASPNEASAPFPPIHPLLYTRTRPRLSRSQASTRDTACPEFVEEQPARHLSDRFHQRHLAGSYTVLSSRFSVRLIIYWPSVGWRAAGNRKPSTVITTIGARCPYIPVSPIPRSRLLFNANPRNQKAIAVGAISVEADVWLFNDTLLVTRPPHDSVSPCHTPPLPLPPTHKCAM